VIVGHIQHGRLHTGPRTLRIRPQTRHEFREREGFGGEIVVCTQIGWRATMSPTVSLAVRMRIGTRFIPEAQCLSDLEPVGVGQHQVEHDGVIFAALCTFQSIPARKKRRRTYVHFSSTARFSIWAIVLSSSMIRMRMISGLYETTYRTSPTSASRLSAEFQQRLLAMSIGREGQTYVDALKLSVTVRIILLALPLCGAYGLEGSGSLCSADPIQHERIMHFWSRTWERQGGDVEGPTVSVRDSADSSKGRASI